MVLREFSFDGYNFEVPLVCPLCNNNTLIRPIESYELGVLSDLVPGIQMRYARPIGAPQQKEPRPTTAACVFITFDCPECGKKFGSIFYFEDFQTKDISFICYAPNVPLSFGKSIPKNIEEISPDFCRIFSESLTAASMQLNELSGFGLRKAIEFLIKDYLAAQENDKNNVESIAKLTLEKAIDKLDDESIKKLAHGIRHGGNDETHYKRKYDFNYNELYTFVTLVVQMLDGKIQIEKSKQRIDDAINSRTKT